MGDNNLLGSFVPIWLLEYYLQIRLIPILLTVAISIVDCCSAPNLQFRLIIVLLVSVIKIIIRGFGMACPFCKILRFRKSRSLARARPFSVLLYFDCLVSITHSVTCLTCLWNNVELLSSIPWTRANYGPLSNTNFAARPTQLRQLGISTMSMVRIPQTNAA